MTFARFHNALRILLNLEREDTGLSSQEWYKFQADPFRYFILADDDVSDRLWRAIEAKQPR